LLILECQLKSLPAGKGRCDATMLNPYSSARLTNILTQDQAMHKTLSLFLPKLFYVFL
jgi:hypothetical protein